MYAAQLCMGTKIHFGVPIETQIDRDHQAGFEGFFTEWDDNIPLYRETAEKLGMIYQSIHAPFYRCADMWAGGETAKAATDGFLHCVDMCAQVEVPIMILHAYIGFGPNDGPNPAGVENYRRVVERAGEKGVKVAFENAEGEPYLAAVMGAFAGYENVGFHLGEDIVTMDLSGELSDSDISKIEKMANEAVAKNMPVTAFYPSPDELETLDYRAKGEIEGDVRIVTIGDVDTCACCAPHVKQTGEIGIIKIVDSMRHRGGMRLSILCGFDALSDYNMRMKEAKEISNLLSVPQSEIASGVKKLNSDLQLMKTKISDMKKQIVKLTVESVQPDKDVLCLFFDDMDMDGLRFGANILLDKKVPFAVLLSGDDENGYSYVLVTSDGDVSSQTKSANEALSGRGGGKGPMATGRFAAKSSDIEKYFVK